jgi:(S)-3,5-dihydroxyphenylglycine transaminase
MASLSEAKSFLTVNSSQIMQASVGAILLTENCSLRRMAALITEHYRSNRDAMLAALQSCFADEQPQVHWNTPAGGFFLMVTLPFPFFPEEAELCARDYQVLAMPLSFFAFSTEYDCKVRLAFSNATPASITEGIRRFSEFVKTRLQRCETDVTD